MIIKFFEDIQSNSVFIGETALAAGSIKVALDMMNGLAPLNDVEVTIPPTF